MSSIMTSPWLLLRKGPPKFYESVSSSAVNAILLGTLVAIIVADVSALTGGNLSFEVSILIFCIEL